MPTAQTLSAHLCCPDCNAKLLPSGDDQARADTIEGHGPRVSIVCSACSRAFAVEGGIPRLIGKNSQLNASEVATQDHVADQYDQIRYRRASSIKYHEDTMQQLIELAPPRGTILDDGCGTGAFLEFVRRRALPVEHYAGIDVSSGMLAHAKRRLDATGDDHLLAQADACRLPFAPNTFDIVYARALLHHLPEPALGLNEIARVLKPGGLAVILDPNKTLVSALPRYLARRTDHFDADHKNFRSEELQRLVSQALHIDETRFFGYLAYPLLGFPDLIDFDRLGIGRLTGPLLSLDRKLGTVPGLRRMGWGVMIRAHK